MKWAIFEFEDETCEVGETSWIMNEDEEKFNNEKWLKSTEIIVRWPKEFGKISKKLGKTPVDIEEIDSILCTATIVKFSDNYQTIKIHFGNYLKTGDIQTPDRGRGHRISKKNARYEHESDVEEEDYSTSKKPQPKKSKYMENSTGSVLNMVKDKYSLDGTDHEELDVDNGEKEESLELRRKNRELQKQVKGLQQQVQGLKQEVTDMRQIVSNMKDFTNVNQSIRELTKTVNSLRPATRGMVSLSPSSSRSSSPLPFLNKMEQGSSQTIDEESTSNNSDDSESNMVLLCPGISVLKAQKKLLDACADAKTYTYTIMEMLWSREVLGSHSMTGKSSNAHKDKEPKPCLDHLKVKALCALVIKRFKAFDQQKVKNLIKSKLQNVEKCQKQKKAMSGQ